MYKEVEYSQVDEKLSDINTYIENTKKWKSKVEKLNIPRQELMAKNFWRGISYIKKYKIWKI